LQRLLSRLNQSDLKLALRKCTDPVSDKIYKNMSERVSAALKDDIKNSPPQSLDSVLEAQRRVAAFVRDLIQKGDVVLPKSGHVDPAAVQENLV